MHNISVPVESAAYQAAFAAIRALHAAGYEAFIIGGAVRDMLLGSTPKDFDIATNATPEQIHAISAFAKTFYKDPAQAYGVSRVHMPDWPHSEIEIATFRRDVDAHLGRKDTTVMYADLESDMKRRDFTVNAIAFDPESGVIVDKVDGLADLDAKRIRFIGEPAQRLQEDPLRLLRAIRFKNRLGFHFADTAITGITSAVEAGLLEKIATDRLRQELNAMLLHPTRKQAFLDLDRLGILARVLPEVTRGKGVIQPPEIHAEGDVWTHTLLAIDALPQRLTERLAWATLLHDIGKPPTQTLPIQHNDRIRFSRHYAVGAEMALGILKRLNFPNRVISDIVWMIEHHINIDDLPHMRAGHQRTMLEHPAFGDLYELHKADAMATWPPSGPHASPPTFPALEAIWHHYQHIASKQPRPSLKRDLGIDGHWIHLTFPETKHAGGGLLGFVLDDLAEAYENEHITDKTALTNRARQAIHQYQQNRK